MFVNVNQTAEIEKREREKERKKHQNSLPQFLPTSQTTVHTQNKTNRRKKLSQTPTKPLVGARVQSDSGDQMVGLEQLRGCQETRLKHR
jgi:hypothetical protein